MEQSPEFKKIKAFAFDVDGVMTTGGITCVPGGDLFRTYDSKDTFAIRMAVMNNYPVTVITGACSTTILDRFRTLCVPDEDIFLNSRNKAADLERFCSRHGFRMDEILYIGDDLPDIPVIKACGLGVCPSDAVEEVKAAADIVSEFPGGKRCVRDALESVMKSQGRWIFDVNEYERWF